MCDPVTVDAAERLNQRRPVQSGPRTGLLILFIDVFVTTQLVKDCLEVGVSVVAWEIG